MVDISFLQIVAHGPRRPHRKWQRNNIDESSDNNTNGQTQEESAAELRRQSLSSEIRGISCASYNQGLVFLKSKKYIHAQDCFETALAARLVIFGPESEHVLEVHNKLRTIAICQGDSQKAAYHKLKIARVQSLVMADMVNREVSYCHDTVDWSVLLKN